MTTIEIVTACIGFLICAVVFSLVGIVIAGIIWYTFKKGMDIEIDSSEWEEEQ